MKSLTKTLVLSALLLSGLSAPLVHAAPSVEKRLEMMKQNLDLTDAQVAQIKPLLESQQGLKEKTPEERKAAMKEFRTEMAKILTPEQLEKYKSMGKEGHKKEKPAEE